MDEVLDNNLFSKNEINLLYEDDFESYAPGEMADGWEIMYNGSGDINQGVFDINGDKCLVANGTKNNSAVIRYPFTFPNAIVKIEVSASHNVGKPSGMYFSNGVVGKGINFQEGWHEFEIYLDFIENKSVIYIDGEFMEEKDLGDSQS